MQLLDTLANSFIQGGYFNSIFYQLFYSALLENAEVTFGHRDEMFGGGREQSKMSRKQNSQPSQE